MKLLDNSVGLSATEIKIFTILSISSISKYVVRGSNNSNWDFSSIMVISSAGCLSKSSVQRSESVIEIVGQFALA